jgi:Mn2+/Fe2+ NRAMP family transporter
MLVANLGTTLAEFAGIGAALSLFGVPVAVSVAASVLVVGVLLARAGFLRVQYVFLVVGAGVSAAYAVSAILARPDWRRSVHDLVVPGGHATSAYLLALVATVGTTITPWGQAFIQSYCADKRLGRDDLRASRLDVAFGSFLTNAIAAFIVIAAAATLWAHGHRDIPDAAAAAKALGPLAGHLAEEVFALGLLGAAFLGLGVVPLTSSYATTEALGLERGLDLRPRHAPAFYGLLAFFLGVAAVVVLVPGLPLIRVMFLAQVVNGLLLPVILVFVMLLSRRRALLGELASGPLLSTLGWFITVVVGAMSIALVVTYVVPR